MDTKEKTAEPSAEEIADAINGGTPGTDAAAEGATEAEPDPAAQEPAPTPEETAAADNATQAESGEAQREEPAPAPAPKEEAKPKGEAKSAAKPKADTDPGKRQLTEAQLDALAAAKGSRFGIYKQKTDEGRWVYAAAGGPPFHDDQVINTLTDRGLLLHEPTGGNHGSAKLTETGLDALRAAGRL